MKKIAFIFFISMFFFANSLFSQSNKTCSDKEFLKMNISDVCKSFGVPGDYNSRYVFIIIPLCERGVVIFDKDPSYYTDNNREYNRKCYFYIGTREQNKKLVRNIVKNKHLIKKGRLVPDAAKKWVVVD